MKYAAIVTYATGEKTGATVRADDEKEAWGKLLEKVNGGRNIRAVELILTNDREIK